MTNKIYFAYHDNRRGPDILGILSKNEYKELKNDQTYSGYLFYKKLNLSSYLVSLPFIGEIENYNYENDVLADNINIKFYKKTTPIYRKKSNKNYTFLDFKNINNVYPCFNDEKSFNENFLKI